MVDQGSYQGAAERLGYTQSTITVQMQQLEEELAAPVSGVPAPALCAWRRGRWVTPAMELFLELLREGLESGQRLRFRSGPGSLLWKGLSIKMMSSPIRWMQSHGM